MPVQGRCSGAQGEKTVDQARVAGGGRRAYVRPAPSVWPAGWTVTVVECAAVGPGGHGEQGERGVARADCRCSARCARTTRTRSPDLVAPARPAIRTPGEVQRGLTIGEHRRGFRKVNEKASAPGQTGRHRNQPDRPSRSLSGEGKHASFPSVNVDRQFGSFCIKSNCFNGASLDDRVIFLPALAIPDAHFFG